MGLIFQKLKVNKENCQKALTSEIYLTEKVYKLVQKGIPFRIGYRKIAKNEKI
jgi:argininosuccinate lyase